VCGRYVLAQPIEDVAAYFGAEVEPELPGSYRPSFNVAPTDAALAVRVGREGERTLRSYRWGLVPSWAKDLSVGNRLFNARAETVATKPAFRAAFAGRRVAVVADGYFEWRKDSGPRQPFYFRRTDGAPLAFAGLWEPWRSPARALEEEGWIRSCTIITTDANNDVATVHNRMPVILDDDVLEAWLDPELHDRDELEALLAPAVSGTLSSYPVGRRVGNVRNNDESLLAPMELEGAGGDLPATGQSLLPF
jgi:putative SOS response-associated peptidase YedK